MRIEPLTCAIGAELSDVRLADAIHDDALFQELRQNNGGGKPEYLTQLVQKRSEVNDHRITVTQRPRRHGPEPRYPRTIRFEVPVMQ